MKVGELLAELFKKASVDASNEKLKPLFDLDIEVEDEFVTPLQTNLFNLDAAKSKKDLKEHFLKPLAQGIDSNVDDFLKANGLDEISAKVKAGTSTGERTKLALAQLFELSKQKANTPELKALQDQIVQLNAQTVEARQALQDREAQLLSDFENERLSSALENKIVAQKWSKNYPESVRSVLAKQLLDAEFAKHGAVLARTEKGIDLLSKETKGQVFDDKNNPITLDSVLSRVFQENNFLEVAQTDPTPQHTTAPDGQRGNTAFDSAMRKSLADQGINF